MTNAFRRFRQNKGQLHQTARAATTCSASLSAAWYVSKVSLRIVQSKASQFMQSSRKPHTTFKVQSHG
eukprot:3331573-Rhodomonas_salina.1